MRSRLVNKTNWHWITNQAIKSIEKQAHEAKQPARISKERRMSIESTKIGLKHLSKHKKL